MSLTLNIAIVSDLHCRHGKADEITTHLYTESPRNPKKQHPIEALKLLIGSKGISADILLCPGDITDKADDQGLSSGWQFFKEISNELKCWLHTASVGNHDVKSREEESKTSNVVDPFHYITTFADDFPIDKEHLRNSFWQQNKHYYIHEDEQLILLNYNSSHSHSSQQNAPISNITDDILQSIEQDLTRHTSKEKIRIALFHHHPKPYANLAQRYKDGDLIERGDELLKLLNKEEFDLVIHGHKHIPRLDYAISKMPIFCSGSFSSLMNVKDLSGKNTFHIIQIEKKDRISRGRIRTYEFIPGHGWDNSSTPKFFPFLTGFGSRFSTAEMISKVNDYFTTKNLTQSTFTELTLAIPEIQYLIPEEQDLFEKELLDKSGFEFLPTLKNGPKLVTKQIV